MTLRPGLLVSVRNVAEAAAALEGGADVIDVKEPSRGPLGRADDQTIAEIVRLVDKRRPVSAALGEWTDHSLPIPNDNLTFVKWGLAGWRGRDWRQSMAQEMTCPRQSPRPVLVAYADWEKADALPVHEVAAAATQWRCGLLVDTFAKKPGVNLLDWLSVTQIEELCRQCRRAEVPVALAGSLGVEEIMTLIEARPNWFGVRGAVCDGGRQGRVLSEKVQVLVKLVKGQEMRPPIGTAFFIQKTASH